MVFGGKAMTVGPDASASSVVSAPVDVVAAISPVLIKTNQEIITSLHLIRDIRRLEKYQRDFFLKVKESLTQVQALLDQQLMDVAWSDHLTECEDNLLKMSTQLKCTPPGRLGEVYSILLHDRDRLTTRFQELSVKSSLSEFVVNCGSLLDLHTVRVAAQAILNNEKPPPVRTDPSIPVDHTFFLANFCTASLASSMMANLVPKGPLQSSTGYGHAARSVCPAPGHRSPVSQRRMNGGVLANGLDVERRLAAAAAVRPMAVTSSHSPPSHSSPSGQKNGSHLSGSSNLDFDVDQPPEGSPCEVPVSGSGGLGYPSGDELVSAISQITARGSAGASGSNASGVQRASDPWHRDVDALALAVSSSALTNVGSDVSDSMSSASDEAAVVAAAVGGGCSPESVKPLSFARIASLHLGDKRSVALTKAVDEVVLAPPCPAPLLAPSPSSLMVPGNVNPRYFMDIVMEGKKLGRVIIEVQPQLAPKMSQNFYSLVTGERGYGYKGCQFFQAWKNESVICGDWEHNSGRGGRSALDEGPLFTPDDTKLPCVRGAVGMRRMSKKHSSLNQVASQFRIILANMNTQFTGIFGHVLVGIDALDKVANVGGEGGRPEKMAVVAQCGLYKP